MKRIVSVADMIVSSNKEDLLITHALGSCLGVAIHDPIACVGGLLHIMLPLSTINQKRAEDNPLVFVDTGVPKLFIECYKAGAKKERLNVSVAGGASPANDKEKGDYFQIGKRNFTVLRKLLWKNEVLLKSHDVGGTDSRTMSLDIGSGEVAIRANGSITKTILVKGKTKGGELANGTKCLGSR